MRHSQILNTIMIGLCGLLLFDSTAYARKAKKPRVKKDDYDSIVNTSPSNPWPKMQKPKAGPAQIIGFYTGGCFVGGQTLPISGAHHEVMRPSRNRYYGHQQLLSLIDRIGSELTNDRILIGDMAQPRGGPTPFGHASHQLGIEADVWIQPVSFFTKSPLTPEQREAIPMTSVVGTDWRTFQPTYWVPAMEKVIMKAASDPMVDRIFINAVVKKYLCSKYPNFDDMNKIRPWYFHNSHFHIRMKCPKDMKQCRNQAPVPAESGCGNDLKWWLSDAAISVQANATEDPVSRVVKIPKACRPVQTSVR